MGVNCNEYPEAPQESFNVYFSLKEVSLKRKIPVKDFEGKLISFTLTFSTCEFVDELYRVLLRIRKGADHDLLKIALGQHNLLKVWANDSLTRTNTHVLVDKKCTLKVSFLGTKCTIQALPSLVPVFECTLPQPASVSLLKTCVSFGGHDPTQKFSFELLKGVIYSCVAQIQDPVAESPLEIAARFLRSNNPPQAPAESKLWTEFTFFGSLETLSGFNPAYVFNMQPRVPLRPRAEPKQKSAPRRKVIVTHDVPGFEDLHVYGDLRRDFGYRFFFWNSIDIFCYFWHKLLMIPPPGYVAVAHRMGAKAIGVLMAEGSGGTEDMVHILRNELPVGGEVMRLSGDYFYADKMIEVCVAHGFDGYLLNVESDIPRDLVPRLLDWIQYLRIKLRAAVPGAEVIWYDSLLETGEVDWQSKLTASNRCFYAVSDGFFTDYHWGLDDLPVSVRYSYDRSPYDVLVGCDLYGRKFFQGGKFNTYLAVDAICKYPLSISFFGVAYFYQQEFGYIGIFTCYYFL